MINLKALSHYLVVNFITNYFFKIMAQATYIEKYV
jgi:hypothetical protein